MSDVFIEIRGGSLAAVYSDIADLRAVIIDWDNIDASPNPFEGCGLFTHDPIASMAASTAAMCLAALAEGEE
ncbi:MAG: hypothetical protein KBC96_14765 [Armatimonadetes bacterium]|nr:hypothetical protein [Armatimonadota bacterium]